MSNSEVLVDLAQSGPSSLYPAVTLLTGVDAKIENVKVHRQQCSDLNGRCADLMLCVRDNSSRLEGIEDAELTDQITAIVRRIDRKVNEWAALSRLNSFLRRGNIEDGIDRLHRDMDATVMRFNVTGVNFKTGEEYHTRNEDRGKAEIRDVLEKIVENTEDMNTLLNMQSSRAIEDVMESLQIELHRSDLRPKQKQTFQQGLWLLHEKTSKLPPLVDLTGQVTLNDTYTIGKRSFQDVFLGEWLGHKPVTLRSPRNLANHPGAQKRFQREVTLWRTFNHPNVLSFYGIIHMEEVVYTICPWMECGNAIAYVQAHPAVDRMRILNDVAAGLEYLHNNDVVHGDLRGANILISSDGTAVVAGFGLSKILEDCGHGTSSSSNLNPRWSAPELLRQTDNHLSPTSDVWSFAMVCLELMTGEQPFKSIARDIVVLRELDKGKLPERPGRQATAHGLKDELWSLMKRCWHKKPDSRPTMSVVKNVLLEIRDLTTTIPMPSKQRSMFFFRRSRNSKPDDTSVSHSQSKPPPAVIVTPKNNVSDKDEQTGHVSGSNLQPLSADSVDASLLSGGILPSFRRFETHPSSYTVSQASSSFTSSSGSHLLEKTHHSDATMSFDSGIQIPLDLRKIATNTSSITQIDDRSGSVSSGSLEGLVEKLISRSRHENDLDYREAFFIGYSDFATSEELLGILTRIFHQVESDPTHAEDTVTVQHHVLEVVYYWLTNPRLLVEPETLRYIKDFCITATQSVNCSTAIKEKAANVLNLIDNHTLLESLSPPSSLFPDRRIPRTSDMTPDDLAIALTLLEGDKYSAILPADCIAHLSRRTHSRSVEAAYLTNNKIVLWVKQSVLHYDTIDSRADVLKFFVNTAVACRKFRNFASTTAIANALHSAPVDRLRLTKRDLPSNLRHNLDELYDLLDPSLNHKTYRAALQDSSSEDSRDRCIPWIAVHLHELYSTLHKYPRIVKVDGVPMINFERYIHFTDRVKEVLHYTVPDLERYRQQGQLTYLEHQLRKVHLTPDIDDKLMERSTALEAGETWDYRTRKRELRQLGFRTS